MKVYFIPGIGADYRIFKHIRIPESYEAAYLHYFPPLRNETIEHYARRLAEGINNDEPFVLAGLSLGGIMATEIDKITNPVATIIISSVYSSAQLPSHFRIGRRLRLHRLIHPLFIKIGASCKHLLLTRGIDNKKHMLKIVWSGSDRFIYWGMNAVLNWSNDLKPVNLCHIHGTMDEVFPIRNCKPDHLIRGNHMLVFNKANEVNKLIEDFLNEIRP